MPSDIIPGNLQLYSIVQAVGTGNWLQVNVPEYLDKSHIHVLVDSLPVEFTWVSDMAVEVLAPVNSLVWVIRRTSTGLRLTRYLDGQELPASVLEVDSKQAFYLAQEAFDLARINGGGGGLGGALGLTAEQIKALLLNQVNFGMLDPVLVELLNQLRDPITVVGSVAWRIAQEAAARANELAQERLDRASALLAAKGDIKVLVDAETAARIQATADLAEQLTSINLTAATTLSQHQAEVTARLAADAALAQQITGVQTGVNQSLADVATETTERLAADSALAQQINATAAKLAGHTALTWELYESLVDAVQVASRRTTGVQAATEEAAAAVLTEQTARITADAALASSITSLQANMGQAQADILAEQTARATADAATATTLSGLQASLADTNAALVVEQTARATADAAFTSSLTTLQATLGNTQAALATEQTARATADSSLAQQITAVAGKLGDFSALAWDALESVLDTTKAVARRSEGLRAEFETADYDVRAQIITEQLTRASAVDALAQQITALSATVASNASSGTAALAAEQTARAAADSALSQQITTAVAGVQSGLDTTNAALVAEQTARASADSALSQQLVTLDAKQTTETGTRSARLADLETALADLREASTRVTKFLRAEFEAADGARAAEIIQLQQAMTTADSALAQQITTLNATVNSNNAATQAAILAEQTARATADSAQATVTDSLSASVGSLGTRMGAVETSASASATDLGVVKANYTFKVQARSDGKLAMAGIGLNATTGGPGSVTQADILLMADRLTFIPSAAQLNAVPTAMFQVGLYNGASTMVLNPVTVGDRTIDARMIVDGGIQARHMTLSDWTNLCANGDGRSTDGWESLAVGTASGSGIYGGAVASTTALTVSARDAFFGPKFQVKVGQEFWASADVQSQGAVASDYGVAIGVTVYNAGGTAIAFYKAAIRPAGTVGYAAVSGSVVVDAPSAAWARVWVQVEGPAGTTWVNQSGKMHYFTNIVVKRRFGGELVVDGSVKARHIDSTGLTIKDSYGRVLLGSGIGLPSDYLGFGLGTNCVPNADFMRCQQGLWGNPSVGTGTGDRGGWKWSGASTGVTVTQLGCAYSAAWNLQGGSTLYLVQTGVAGSASKYAEVVQSVNVPVEGGKRYCLSVYTGAHRCTVQAFVFAYTSAGTFVNAYCWSSNASEALGGATIQGYKRQFGMDVLPSNVAYVRVALRKLDTTAGQPDSWMFATRVQLEMVAGAATEPAPWADGGQAGIKVTPSTVSTWIDNAAIGSAQVGQLTAANLTVSAVSGTINGGAASGGRVEVQTNKVLVYDTSNVLRVKLGYLL